MQENENMEVVISKKKRFPIWIIIAIATVVIALVIVTIYVNGKDSPEKKIAEKLELARMYVSELNYEQAVILYEDIIKIDPKNTDAYIELAEAYVKSGDTRKAEETLAEAAKNVDGSDKEKIERKIKEVKNEADASRDDNTTTPNSSGTDLDTSDSDITDNGNETGDEAQNPDDMEAPRVEVTFDIDDHLTVVEEDGSTVIADGKTGEFNEGDVIRFQVAEAEAGYTYDVALTESDETGANLGDVLEDASRTWVVTVGKGNLTIRVVSKVDETYVADNTAEGQDTGTDDAGTGEEQNTGTGEEQNTGGDQNTVVQPVVVTVSYDIDENVKVVAENGTTEIKNGKREQYNAGETVRFRVRDNGEGLEYNVELTGSNAGGATLKEISIGGEAGYELTLGNGNANVKVTVIEEAVETHKVTFAIGDNVSVSDAEVVEEDDEDADFADGSSGEYDEGEVIKLFVEADQGYVANLTLQGAGAASSKVSSKAGLDGTFYDITVGKGDVTVKVTSSIDPNTGAAVEFGDLTFEKAVREAVGWDDGDDIWEKDAEGVKELTIDVALLTNISDLKYFKNLEVLDLGGTSLKDISVLSGLTKLKELYLNETKVTDISALSKLTNLKELDLSETSVSNVSALSGLTKLEVLSLESTSVTNISSLSGLTAMKELSLTDTEVSDISALKGMTNMTDLDLWGTEVESISAVSGMTKLQELKLWGTNVSNLSPLKNLKKLTYLDLSGTDVEDVSPIAGLTQLEYLNLSNTDVDEDTEELDDLENTEIVWE